MDIEGISKSDVIIVNNMKWLIGRLLDYIDISVESDDSEGRFSKKKRLKKLFNEAVYGVVNDDLMKNSPQVFDDLKGKLEQLVRLSTSDEVKRDEFISLIKARVNEARERIEGELDEPGE